MEFERKVVNSKIILCDIEGTTSSIDFVKDTLFPYALKNVEKFLQENWERDDVKEAVVELKKLSDKDVEEKTEGAVPVLGDDEDKVKIQESVVKNVEWLMSNDRKVTPLKTLQGLIWEAGYKDGTIKGHVYDDVPKAFENWTKTGHKIYIYSSGSVMAQKLLFGHTTSGDMQPHLSGYFDTKIGAKQEKESYESIVKEMECDADEVLFLTDIVKEAKAARDAGVNVVILERPGNAALTDEEKKEYRIIDSFELLPLEEVTTGKRKIQEEVDDQKQETTKPAKIAKLEEDNAAAADKPEKMEEAQDKKTDVESKCDTAVVEKEKTEIDRTDGNSKTDQETESKVEEKMEVDVSEEKEVVVAEKKVEVVKEEEKKVEEDKAVTTDEKKDEIEEKMEVDAAVESIEEVAEKKVDDDKEVTEAEPKLMEEKESSAPETATEPEKATETVVEVAAEAVEEIVTETATEVIAETVTKSVEVSETTTSTSKTAEEDTSKEIETGLEADVTAEITEVVKSTSKVETEDLSSVKPEVTTTAATETTEVDSTAEKKEEAVNGKMAAVAAESEEKKKEEEEKVEEKVTENTNGNAAVPDVVVTDSAEALNGDAKGDEVEKTENGKDEVKNGHKMEENAATSQDADGEKTAQDSTESATSTATNDQVSGEVIVKKCVDAVVKSPVTQTVEAES
ncbi:Enolase-phosphatase E1 [Sergentomyia squamirostris]